MMFVDYIQDMRPNARLDLLLIDDDNKSVTTSIKTIGAAGHYVQVVKNVTDTLSAIRRYPFDLVLLDINLTDANAMELIKTLKEMPDCKGMLPIIAMSERRCPTELRQCFQLGVSNFLLKPLTLTAIQDALMPYQHHKSQFTPI